ncbi:MAG TPA: ABC transporter substrate-binding protein [Candidatus Limnocylindria bacterium]|nr:ABC transporter substrate-binding protein [Candidatus Limnocylindria bacterium]
MRGARHFICLLLAATLFAGLAAGVHAEPAKEYERIVITYACPQVVAGYDYNTGDEYSKFIVDKFNFEFQPTNLPWDSWHNMLSTWIMSQDMTDVAIFNYGDGTHADASNFVSQGLLKRLPDDWKTRWPGVASVYETTSLGPMLEELYGGTYFIPRARFFYNLPGDPLANHWSLWMRSDWVEAVGKEVKNHYSIPEVLEIARLIKEQDPGSLGASLAPMSMTAQNAARFFVEANSTYWNTFYKGEDGKYAWGAAAPETLEGLKLWYQAFSTGVLDPEFYLLTFEKDMEKFQTLGTAGVSYLGGQTADVQNYRTIFEMRTGIDSDAFLMATLLGADGNYHQRDLINFWGAVCFSPDVEDAVFERWMDLMEFTSSPEGYPGTQMGLKGVDWDRDANGDIVSLVPPGTLLAGAVGEGKYPSLGHVLGSVILWDDLAFDNPNIGKEYRDESRALYQNRYEFGPAETFVKADWNLWLNFTENLRRARGINYPVEYANLVTNATSEADLVERYNAWLDSQMSLIQPVLNDLNP